MGWSHTFGSLSGTIPLSYLDDNFGNAVLLSSLQLKHQVFTSSGTYTPSSGMVYCRVQLQAAGGAGGGIGSGVTGAAGGGSAGATSEKIFSASDIGTSQTVTLGAAGGGQAGADGADAQNSSFGSLLAATGGKGGKHATTVGAFAGGAGVSATGGDINISSNAGQPGIAITGMLFSGHGGNSMFGEGGASQVAASDAAVGRDGTGYGAAGSGAINNAGATSLAGGSGSGAICIVTEVIAASS